MKRRLPALKAGVVIRALKRAGFVVRRVRGSHYQLSHPNNTRLRVTVPYHGKDLRPNTLREIIRQAGLEVGEFKDLL